jgi:membrane protease YdiL (CAAX protease family)
MELLWGDVKELEKKCCRGDFFSIPILVVATLLKLWIVHYIPAFQNNPLIDFSFDSPLHNPQILIALIYTPLTLPQEFIARGTLQSSVKLCLLGTNRSLKAIVLSSLLFSSFHAILSPVYALAAFVLGLYWGWIYSRQESLVGCAISHAIIGVWSLSVLGLGDVFFKYLKAGS